MSFIGKNKTWCWTKGEETEVKKLEEKRDKRRQLTLNQKTLGA